MVRSYGDRERAPARCCVSCTSGATMRMHQDVLVAALPEPLILASSPLAPARPVELAVLFCFWALAFRCTTRPGWSTRRAARCSPRNPRCQGSTRGRDRHEQQTQAGYQCAKVRKRSTPTFDGHTPAGTKEGRGRGCMVSHCTPSAIRRRRRRRSSSHRDRPRLNIPQGCWIFIST